MKVYHNDVTSDGVIDANELIDPQPYVKVGSVGPGDASGTITISPDAVYQGETDQNFLITFIPKGPIYDGTLWLTIPDALVTGDDDNSNTTAEVAFIRDHTRIEYRVDGRTTTQNASDVIYDSVPNPTQIMEG